ncbi:MAG TPA: tyrosine-type recombinase/integrase [Candidatus Acidoferrum sp.]|nr:tyrosine-type recombinase/integrase [Candidatus Acidoferrum sp.]
MKKITFPFVVKRGSVSVKIYRTPSNGCDSFTISYYQDGVRKRPTFSTFQAARDEADVVVNRLGNSDSDILVLTSADRAAYLRARQLLDPFGLAIETAAAQVVEARKQLGDIPLAQAVEFYLKRHPVKLELKPVNAVVEELLAAKAADGCSERYLQSLRYCLRKFEVRFHTNISMVSGIDIDVWLRESGLSPRTRNNIRGSVHALFKFAKLKRYLPKDHDEIESVAVVNDRGGDIEVFTPAELGEILKCANERMIPFLVLSAFAGIRHAEIQRLDWSDIHFDDGIIEIGASKAKTASRRIVPVLPNLREWLMKFRQVSGPVVSHNNVAFELHLITKRVNEARRRAWALAKGIELENMKPAKRTKRMQAKQVRTGGKHKGNVPPGARTAKEEGWNAFAWKHNALRHSFISYRVADIQNVAQVALEAGNSPQMIFKHYRELVRPAEAVKWFSITPDGGEKVIMMPKPAKAMKS